MNKIMSISIAYLIININQDLYLKRKSEQWTPIEHV